MKINITKKMILLNISILLFALFIFFCVVTLIFNHFMRENIEEQLLTENKMALKTLASPSVSEGNFARNIENTVIYNQLSDSIRLVYRQTTNTGEYRLTTNNTKSFDAPENTDEFLQSIQASENNIIEITLDDKDYLCTYSKSKSTQTRVNSVIVVSLIALDDIKSINRKYIIAFLLTSVALMLIALLLISIFSKKITQPIIELTKLTKAYEKRDFNKSHIVNTNDEIKDLSVSINNMAMSLKKHDEEKERLFRHISHELKTPLTAIYGYAEGVKTNIFDDNDEPLDIIMSESLRIKRMTEDLIFLSKLESNVEKFDFQLCDIGMLIEKSIRSIESLAILNDIDIFYNPINTTKIYVDEDKIFRAIVNILSNCIKYTKDTIEIKLYDDKNKLKIEISDNGNGFKKSDIENLSKGIYQEKNLGSGIGLSIVHNIIKKHNGRFLIQNKENQSGALFKIYLQQS